MWTSDKIWGRLAEERLRMLNFVFLTRRLLLCQDLQNNSFNLRSYFLFFGFQTPGREKLKNECHTVIYFICITLSLVESQPLTYSSKKNSNILMHKYCFLFFGFWVWRFLCFLLYQYRPSREPKSYEPFLLVKESSPKWPIQLYKLKVWNSRTAQVQKFL